MFAFRRRKELPNTLERASANHEVRLRALEAELSKLRKERDEVLEAQDSLTEQFKRLRGMVTGGARLRSGAARVGEIPFGDKAALRAAVGLTAGQRPLINDEGE